MDNKIFVATWFFVIAVYFIYLIVHETLSYKKEKERPKPNNFLIFSKELGEPGIVAGFVESIEKAKEIVSEYDIIEVSEEAWENIKVIQAEAGSKDQRIIIRVHAEPVKGRTSWR